MEHKKRVVNKDMAARSVTRLIEDLVPLQPEQRLGTIQKPKERKKRLPGTALLIKIAKQNAKEKEKRAAERMVKQTRPVIDEAAVESALDEVMADLRI